MSQTPHILICDDDPVVHESLGLYLENEHFTYSDAYDGREALNMIADAKPDLILLDVMMPELTGLEVCREIRKTLTTPIIFLTAKGEEIDRPSLAASFTKAVSDSLVPRTMLAAEELGYDTIVVAGGVAANKRIRADFTEAAAGAGKKPYVPPLRLCGDNGAMIGAQGYYEYLAGTRAGSDLNAYATMEI